jgi:hypothetical protein
MESITDYESIYYLARSNRMDLEELLGYLRRDSNVSDKRLEREGQKLEYLRNIESNMSMFVKESD